MFCAPSHYDMQKLYSIRNKPIYFYIMDVIWPMFIMYPNNEREREREREISLVIGWGRMINCMRLSLIHPFAKDLNCRERSRKGVQFCPFPFSVSLTFILLWVCFHNTHNLRNVGIPLQQKRNTTLKN